MAIQFGTDGWRAVISEEFTFANVRLVAQAVADWVHETAGDAEPSVAVGFDTRFLSDRYAREVARVLAGNGVRVFLTRADVPTPALSHAVRHLGAAAGVMITASHNPPRYNGFKLKLPCGGPAGSEESRRVEAILRRNQTEGRAPRLADFGEAEREGRIQRFDPLPAYLGHLAHLVDLERVAASGLRAVVDPMYGSGRGCLAGLLKNLGLPVEELHGEMNPGFGGLHPEPIARNLGAMSARLMGGGWDVGLALDGDADRIGAVDARGRFVDPHCIFALALRYLAGDRGWRGSVVKTLSTTGRIDVLAAQYGLPVRETAVGFHHIRAWMQREEVLIGGEESGGMSILGHIPEGDGILMGLLLLEVLAARRLSLEEALEDLAEEVGRWWYDRRDVPTFPVAKAVLTRRLVEGAPVALNGQRVQEVSDLDGVKYLLEDGSWLLIRPSGTEPVLRIYAEARSPETVERLLAAGERLGYQAQGAGEVRTG
ncbi:MAG: phosphoglucomutase/phosphomannomutase family protein [Anaerolineae bacterium]